MRAGPSSAKLATAVSYTPRVQSWLGADVLAESVPITSGYATWNAANKVVDDLKITVPRFADGQDWLPDHPDHPLARFGQQLDVTVTVDGFDIRLGRFIIADWDYDEATITVTGVGLMQTAVDARLMNHAAPRDGGTLMSELVRFVPSLMAVQFDPALVDRAVPASTNWDQERIDILYSIADAWPAVLRPDAWGQLVVKPAPRFTSPAVSLTDGEGGTVVSVPRQDTRDGAFNVVKASSSADGVNVSAVSRTLSGPMAVDRYGVVLKSIESPALVTEDQCFDAADAERRRSLRQSSVLQVTMAPDPRLELDDPIEVIREGQRDWGLIVAAEIPLTVRDGAMRIDVGVL